MAKKSLAEMVASQRKANQVKHGPINTFGQNATDIAYPEDSATQKMLQTVATPDQTKVTPDAEVNLDAPAIDETPPIDNTTKAVAPTAKPEDDEDAIITHAMKTLGDRLREAAPHVDFTEEYKKLLEEDGTAS